MTVHVNYTLNTKILLGCLFFIITAVGAIGNFIVIFAVARERKLHSRAHYLIASLAAADLLVSLLISPFFAFMMLHDGYFDAWWSPEQLTCQLFIFLDVACCTASILHLCVIAWVRYRTVSKISMRLYSNEFCHVLPTIGVIWLLAGLLSFAPHLAFPSHSVTMYDSIDATKENVINATDFNGTKTKHTSLSATVVSTDTPHLACAVSDNKIYRLVATSVAFYVPLVVILIIYFKMANIAWTRLHMRRSSSYARRRPMRLKKTNTEIVLVTDSRSPVEHVNNNGDLMCKNHSQTVESHTDCSECSYVIVDIKKVKNHSKAPKLSNCGQTNVVGLFKNGNDLDNTFTQSEILDCLVEIKPNNASKTSGFKTSLRTKLLSKNLFNNYANSKDSGLPDIVGSYSKLSTPNLNSQTNVSSEENKQKLNALKRSNSVQYCIASQSKKFSITSSSSLYDFRGRDLYSSYSTIMRHKDNQNFNLSTDSSRRSSKSTVHNDSTKQRKSGDLECNLRPWRNSSVRLRREIKIIKTLGMVIGAFILCWLPFFLKEVILPFCDSCTLSTSWETFINWLGYANSALNPFIYAFSNDDFNMAFRRILRRKSLKTYFLRASTHR